MNKIFKVVWNRTIQSFVVTSELAKGRVKSSAEQNSTDVSAESGKNGIATVFRLTVISADTSVLFCSADDFTRPLANSEVTTKD